MDVLTEPFGPAYMQRAWLELALLAVPAGALGAFVVLRRLPFAAHAFGVGTFPGAVAALALGASAFVGGLVAAGVMAGLLAVLQRRRDLDAAASTGLLLAGALALGALLVSDVLDVGASGDALLFGSLLGVTDADLARSAIVAALSLLAVGVAGRAWLVVAFDRTHAPALGFAPGRYDIALFLLLAVSVVAAVDAVGSLLASTFLVVPAATARLFTRRLGPLVACSSALALVVATAGLVTSFHVDAPPGATVAAIAAGVFLVAFVARSLAEPARRRAALAGGVAAVVAVIAGCGGSDGVSEPTGGVRVVATTGLVADWVREVGGDRVEVVSLLDPLVDPHEYEPTPQDAEAVAEADVLMRSGAGLDEWAAELAESAGGPEPVAVAPVGDEDPHFWHDPTLTAQAVRTIEQALVQADPEGAETYAANGDRYVGELDALDAELRAAVEAIPAERRTMVTDHDAFGYLAALLGIDVVGTAIPSTSTAAEPNAQDTAALIETIRAEGVCALFSESSVDPKLIEQIAAETGARVFPDLYGDTLGPEGSDAATYLGMMRHNVAVLLGGFGC